VKAVGAVGAEQDTSQSHVRGGLPFLIGRGMAAFGWNEVASLRVIVMPSRAAADKAFQSNRDASYKPKLSRNCMPCETDSAVSIAVSNPA